MASAPARTSPAFAADAARNPPSRAVLARLAPGRGKLSAGADLQRRSR
jgi:hypothetical protein